MRLDSAGCSVLSNTTIIGVLEISRGGRSFIFEPNQPSPFFHDNMKVTTGIFTIMQGTKMLFMDQYGNTQ